MVVLERVCIMRWDSELEEGVFTIVLCSGVVTGPNMLTIDHKVGFIFLFFHVCYYQTVS